MEVGHALPQKPSTYINRHISTFSNFFFPTQKSIGYHRFYARPNFFTYSTEFYGSLRKSMVARWDAWCTGSCGGLQKLKGGLARLGKCYAPHLSSHCHLRNFFHYKASPPLLVLSHHQFLF